jgi:hypothetical protein
MFKTLLIASLLIFVACSRKSGGTHDLLVGDGRKAWLIARDSAYSQRDPGIVLDVFYRFDTSGLVIAVIRYGDGSLDSLFDTGDLVIDNSWHLLSDSVLKFHGRDRKLTTINNDRVIMQYSGVDVSNPSRPREFHDTLISIPTYLDGKGCRWNAAEIGHILTSDSNRSWLVHSSNPQRRMHQWQFNTACGWKVLIGAAPGKFSNGASQIRDSIIDTWYVVSDSVLRLSNRTYYVESMSRDRIALRYGVSSGPQHDTLFAK